MNLDNPWPDRQSMDDDEREQHAYQVILWKESAHVRNLAQAIHDARKELESSFHARFDYDLSDAMGDESFREFFGLK